MAELRIIQAALGITPIAQLLRPPRRPELTPKQMLALGVFGGKYMTDCRNEFPASWFARARLSPSASNAALNYFGVDASQPLSVWRDKGWIHPDDPRGWFQWYCRYYMGRRMTTEGAHQIKRWKALRRHIAQIRRHCEPVRSSSCSRRPARKSRKNPPASTSRDGLADRLAKLEARAQLPFWRRALGYASDPPELTARARKKLTAQLRSIFSDRTEANPRSGMQLWGTGA